MKNDSTITLELLYAKNGSKKHLIFEKWEYFENSQNWPRGKGYRLCKIATLAQKLKMPKTCEKRFYNHVRVVVCKKRLQKTPNIRKKSILKIAKIGLEAKAIDFAKHVKNDSTITLELLYAKNGSKKHLIFEKWEHFENSQNWPRGKGYRTPLGQKHLIFEKWELKN